MAESERTNGQHQPQIHEYEDSIIEIKTEDISTSDVYSPININDALNRLEKLPNTTSSEHVTTVKINIDELSSEEFMQPSSANGFDEITVFENIPTSLSEDIPANGEEEDECNVSESVDDMTVMWCPACYEVFHDKSSLDDHFQHHCRNSTPTNLAIDRIGTSPEYTLIEPIKIEDVSQLQITDLRKAEITSPNHAILDPNDVREYLPKRRRQNKNFGDFQCSICELKFKKNDYLRQHVRRMHTLDLPYQCSKCPSKFLNNCDLRRHEPTHDNTPGRRRRSHMNRCSPLKVGEGNHLCPICNAGFFDIPALDSHMSKEHREVVPYSCDICERKLRFKANLSIHMEQHFSSALYRCKVCLKEFNHPSNMKRHAKTHESKKSIECSFCNEKFGRKDALKVHVRNKHTRDLPYLCPHCPAKFLYKSWLEDHENFHTGLDKYHCDACNDNFATKDALLKHLHKHLESTKRFTCNFCSKTWFYRHKKRLAEHILEHLNGAMVETQNSGDIVECSKCKRQFKEIPVMQLHFGRKHVHQCPQCPDSFIHKSELMRHYVSHSYV